MKIESGLAGKTVLVTGGGRGIGRAIVELFARDGADVAFFYRGNAAAAAEVVEQARAAGLKVKAEQVDVTDVKAVGAAVERLAGEWGRIDVLVNNAGVIRDNLLGLLEDEDIRVVRVFAQQAAIAIENARLFEESSKSLTEAEALYRQYLRQAWGRMPKEQQLEGYHYSVMGATPIERLSEIEKDRRSDRSRRPGISVPIMLRGESIGTLAIQVPEAGQVNEDQMDLIKAVAERVAISAENARLFEETTRRAERERLVTDITAKIRSTNDPDVMIQTALDELKTALGATKVQLVPHTLQQSKAKPMPETPSNPPRKSKKSEQSTTGGKK